MAAHGANFYDGSIDKVLNAVANFRAENSLPLGDPEHELAEQYMAIAPWLVYEGPDHSLPEQQLIAEWIMRHWGRQTESHGIFTDIPKNRQEVCRTCPHFAHDPSLDGDRYARTANGRAAVLAGDKDWHIHGVCRHHHWPVLIASRLVKPEVLATPESPVHCWANPKTQ